MFYFKEYFYFLNIRPMNLKQSIMVVLWKIPKPTKLVNAHIKMMYIYLIQPCKICYDPTLVMNELLY